MGTSADKSTRQPGDPLVSGSATHAAVDDRVGGRACVRAWSAAVCAIPAADAAGAAGRCYRASAVADLLRRALALRWRSCRRRSLRRGSQFPRRACRRLCRHNLWLRLRLRLLRRRPDASSGVDALGDGDTTVALVVVHPHPQPDLSQLPPGTSGDVIVDVVIDKDGADREVHDDARHGAWRRPDRARDDSAVDLSAGHA